MAVNYSCSIHRLFFTIEASYCPQSSPRAAPC